MSGNIIPLTPAAAAMPATTGAPTLPSWGTPPPTQKTPQLQRILAVLGRFKWLIVGLTVLGIVGGVVATRFVEPQYVATSQLLIRSESPLSSGRGSAQSAELLNSSAWIGLFQSGAVADEVVRQLGLFVTPEQPTDSLLFRDFELAERFATGNYELTVANGRMRLTAENAQAAEEAAVGDSIGNRQFGFLWRPNPALLSGERTVAFTVVHPRTAGQRLTNALSPRIVNDTYLQLSLTGASPERTARILEVWVREFTETAGELKQAKLREQANIQMDNLRIAEEALTQSSRSLEEFKVGTITLPSEGTTVAAGVEETQGTVLGNFFGDRQRLEDVRNVRENIERIVSNSRESGTLSDTDLFTLATITNGANNERIRALTAELNTKEAERRAALRFFTDTNPTVVELSRQVNALRNVALPAAAQSLLAWARQQERDLERQLAGQERELQGIPARSMREQDLQRNVAVNEAIYTGLRTSAAQANLAVQTALPDVDVLDWPVPPVDPTANTVPQILAMAILGGLGLGILLALLIDRLDQRFRYPEQAKDDLGLDIVGAVPRLRAMPKGEHDAEEGAQVLESFRQLRVNLRHSVQGPLAVTVSSAAAGDGKSLVASNLAVSFALAGHRVLLIDGDIRRGALHASFGLPQRPGLSEVLIGDAAQADALRPTQHPNLTLLPCGVRSRRAPELLASAAMTDLLAQLRGTFDVIVVDSPPLSAGIDASTLGMATGALVFVIRAGRTNMRLAQAKLSEVDKLPIYVPGAVLNGITPSSVYGYYPYDYGYAANDGEEEGAEPELAIAGGSAGSPQLYDETPTDRA